MTKSHMHADKTGSRFDEKDYDSGYGSVESIVPNRNFDGEIHGQQDIQIWNSGASTLETVICMQ